jgi:hypothetical protein
VIRSALAFCMMIVIGLMTVASALPKTSCIHAGGQFDCMDSCDCDCAPEHTPLPDCCLELGELPEMMQPHTEHTPKSGAAVWVDAASKLVAAPSACEKAMAADLQVMCVERYFRIYQVILC